LAAQRGSDLLAGVDMEALQRDVMEVVQLRQPFLIRHIYFRSNNFFPSFHV